MDNKGQHHVMKLRKALYIPSYSQDMFSVKEATANGATVIFKQGKNVLIHKDGTRFKIHMFEGLYYLKTQSNESEDKCKSFYAEMA